jgi:ribosomal protein S18 acetylase RimI-like enzyme
LKEKKMTTPDLYPIENAPEIEGLIFRHFEGESDYPKMLAIFTNLHAVEQYSGETTIASLRAEYTNLSNSDPQDDLIFVDLNRETVAFCRVYWERQVATGQYSYGILFRVDPAWQGQGIEQSLIAWGESHGRHYASVLPEGINGFFVTQCREPDRTRFNILMESGFTIDRYYHSMSRPLTDLPERPLPEGISVRPVLPKDFRKVWEAANEAFMDEYGAADPTENWYQSYKASPNFQPFLWQVAFYNDEVVGSVQNYVSLEENELEGHMRGYTEGISVRREWRGRGVASALICRSMAMFKAMNMDEVALTADTQNPTGAMRLYTNLGYQPYMTLLELHKNMECLNS